MTPDPMDLADLARRSGGSDLRFTLIAAVAAFAAGALIALLIL